jgi:hypothetical protein
MMSASGGHLCPEGAFEDSPAIHGWVWNRKNLHSPSGTIDTADLGSAVPTGLHETVVLSSQRRPCKHGARAGLLSIDPPGRKHAATQLVFAIDVGNDKA